MRPPKNINAPQPFEEWRERPERKKGKAKARRLVERTRNRELRRAAGISRADARAAGRGTYTGCPCRHHPTNTTRRTNDGFCVECSREIADRHRMAAGTYGGRGRRKPRKPRQGGHVPFVRSRRVEAA